MSHFLFVTRYSGGDLFPMLAVGRVLVQRGHRVTVFTHAHHRAHVTAAGLAFVARDTEEEARELERDAPNAGGHAATPERHLQFRQKHCTPERLLAEYESFAALCSDDAIVVARYSTSHAALLAAEKHGLAVTSVLFAPHFAVEAMMTEHIMGADYLREISPVRAQLGLPPIQSWLDWMTRTRTALAMWPAWFTTIEPECRVPHVRYTGFPLAAIGERRREPDVDELFAAGEPPVLITPGTSGLVSTALVDAAVQGSLDAGFRVALVTEHDELVPALPSGSQRLRFLDFAHHMPRMAAVIHHGGIGTVARAFASGIPQVVLAELLDRPYNAQLVQRTGAGVNIPRARWSPRAVADALRRVTGDEHRARARTLAERVRDEDGVAGAATVLEEIARQPAAHRFPVVEPAPGVS